MSPKSQGAVDDHGLGLGRAAGVRRSLDHLGSILRPGERIVCGAQGFLEGRPGLVVATSIRFLFIYRDETPIDSVYEDITRFRAKVGIVASDLEIEDANGVASIRQIHPRARLADLAGILQKGPGVAVGAAPLAGVGGSPGAGGPPGSAKKPADTGTRTPPGGAPEPSAGADDPDSAEWKPKLRPKISPLAPRHEGAGPGSGVGEPQPSSLRPAPAVTPPPTGVTGVAGTVSAPAAVPSPGAAARPPGSPGAPRPSRPGGGGDSPPPTRPQEPAWRPRLGAVDQPGEVREPIQLAARGSALTGTNPQVAMPVADQLLPGEWVVATFAQLTASTEGHEPVGASAAVTNRRLLLRTPAGTPVEAWPLTAVEVQESASGERARLVGGIDLEFTSSELAAGFSEAIKNASDLLGS